MFKCDLTHVQDIPRVMCVFLQQFANCTHVSVQLPLNIGRNVETIPN